MCVTGGLVCAISGDYRAQQRSVLRVEKKTEKLMEYFSGKLAERTTGARVDTMSRKKWVCKLGWCL